MRKRGVVKMSHLTSVPFKGGLSRNGASKFKHSCKRVFFINFPIISSPVDPDDHHVPMYYECVGWELFSRDVTVKEF